jgi:hypothetical protein
MKIKSAVLCIDGAAVQEHFAAGLKLTMNVSHEADLDFMAELKGRDRARYDRVMDAMRKQAYRSLKAA